MQNRKSYIWTPIPLDHLLSRYHLHSPRLLIPLGIWICSIAAALASTIYLLPDPELIFEGQRTEIINFFLFNPAYIIGLLLFFWFGFEWGFIPVFLSTFIIAFQSSMPLGWALIFAFSFVLGITIFALAYQSFKIPFDLRSLKSIAFYISISFIASIASSLGSFIWSLSHTLSALDTLTLWNGWWSGGFLQSVLFIGPALFFLTPAVAYLKHRFLAVPQPPPISAKWVYGSVVSITVILVVFILSGKILGELRIEEVITASQHITLASVLGALESFEIISWISIGLILLTGYGAIYIFSGWNRSLNEEVKSEQLSWTKVNGSCRNHLKKRNSCSTRSTTVSRTTWPWSVPCLSCRKLPVQATSPRSKNCFKPRGLASNRWRWPMRHCTKQKIFHP